MFSRVRNAIKLSLSFYDHSNYFKMAAIWVKIGVLRLNTYSRGVILLWELQIDGSINYWLFKLDERDLFAEQKCDKRGQILSIF